MMLIKPLGALLAVMFLISTIAMPWGKIPLTTERLLAAAIAPVTSAGGLIDGWIKSLEVGWSHLTTWLILVGQTIKDRWLAWWQGNGPSLPVVAKEQTTTANFQINLSPELELAIRQEIARQLNGRVATTTTVVLPREETGGSPDQAIVILPAPADLTSVELAKLVEQSFSDPVTVTFDETGRSGEIKPRFAPTSNRRYYFVLTPVPQ